MSMRAWYAKLGAGMTAIGAALIISQPLPTAALTLPSLNDWLALEAPSSPAGPKIETPSSPEETQPQPPADTSESTASTTLSIPSQTLPVRKSPSDKQVQPTVVSTKPTQRRPQPTPARGAGPSETAQTPPRQDAATAPADKNLTYQVSDLSTLQTVRIQVLSAVLIGLGIGFLAISYLPQRRDRREFQVRQGVVRPRIQRSYE